jgi:DNA-binding transcriptional LysR family regulator
MQSVDLNLLVALDALLAERSVTAAARRLGLSPSAMSRTLARLRSATGDQLLVQAGRALVPTPYAEELGRRVPALAREAQAVLRPAAGRLDLAALDRTFTLRAGEGFVDLLSGPLAAAVIQAAPHVRLRFAPKPDKDALPLRDGSIDLEIGVVGSSAPEVRTQLLFRDRFIGICRAGHPLLAGAGVTPERYAACRHVVASRRGQASGPVDAALARLGLTRTVVLVVPAYTNALQVAYNSDLVALAPRLSLGNALTSNRAEAGLQGFELPVRTPEIAISAQWHPRMDGDPAHRWLRQTVAAVCRSAYPT